MGNKPAKTESNADKPVEVHNNNDDSTIKNHADELKWTIHPKPETHIISNNLIQTGDSLWYSTNYGIGESGMVEYCLKTNAQKQMVKYPTNFQPCRHAVCKYKNKVYFIDGFKERSITEFDPKTRQFIKKLTIPQ